MNTENAKFNGKTIYQGSHHLKRIRRIYQDGKMISDGNRIFVYKPIEMKIAKPNERLSKRPNPRARQNLILLSSKKKVAQ